MAKPILTQELLKKLIHYDPERGTFTRLPHKCPTCGRSTSKGKPVGWATKHGFSYRVVITLEKQKYAAHRLAWFYMTGNWPRNLIDHMDGNSANNRFDNLREATQAQNTQNQRRARSDNKSGVLGVENNGRRWTARIRVNGVRTYLGSFATEQEAHAAYLAAKRRLHEFCTI